jgi:hypothetical protein
MSDHPFATGRCVCGAVTYTLNAEPLRMAQCHCKDCQRASGTGHMSLAFFGKDDVVVTGQTSEYASTADSGNINTRRFCPNCGSRLFGRNSARPEVMAVAVGTIDDHTWFKPQAIVYGRSKPDWDCMAAEVPTFEMMPPPPPPQASS